MKVYNSMIYVNSGSILWLDIGIDANIGVIVV